MSTTEDLRRFSFPENVVSDKDMERWLQERFLFSDQAGKRFILCQRQGGPCGVIASVQSEVIGYLLFAQGLSQSEMESINEDSAKKALVHSLARILWRVRDGSEPCIVCSGSVEEDNIQQKQCSSVDATAESIAGNLDDFQSPGGVMLFVYSLLLTRSLDKIRDDMDDESQGLTGQFGHCTQELMNLLLTGVASSQVHDGTVDLGGGMKLRGIQEKPQIGYLTHLESLRYCQVGMFYKKPVLPIWVIGSDSHYTVLYGLDKTLNHESMRTLQLNRAKRAFNELAQDETGFVSIEKLPDVVRSLDIEMSEAEMSSFVSRCEMSGAGIVLWNTFWTNIKPKLVPRLQWNCHACTYLNDASADTCEMCTTRRKDDMIVGDDGEEGETDEPKTIDLVHVNGLISMKQGVEQGPTLTKFLLTIVSKDLQAPSTHGLGVPIEEVLHTRWSGAVFLFPNDTPPSISG